MEEKTPDGNNKENIDNPFDDPEKLYQVKLSTKKNYAGFKIYLKIKKLGQF